MLHCVDRALRFIRLSAYDFFWLLPFTINLMSAASSGLAISFGIGIGFRQSLLRVRFTAFVFSLCLFFSCVLYCSVRNRSSRLEECVCVFVRIFRVRLRRPDATRSGRVALSQRVIAAIGAASLSLPFALALSLSLEQCACLRRPKLTFAQSAHLTLDASHAPLFTVFNRIH